MVVESVITLAATQNPSGITTAAIAAHMGVSQGAVFRHFATKEAIWQAVMEWVAEQLLDRVVRAAESADGPMAALEAVFMTHVSFAVEYPGVPRMLFGELQRTEPTPAKGAVEGLLQKYGHLLADLLEQGKREGMIDQGVETFAAISMFIGAIQGLIIRSLLGGDMENALRVAPQTFELYRRAVRRLP